MFIPEQDKYEEKKDQYSTLQLKTQILKLNILLAFLKGEKI
jgi:hypothetical protein